MAIRQIIEIPEDLPPARLFLDDIEALTEIFCEAVNCVPSSVHYVVRESYCESIEDLRKIGGTHGEFTIEGPEFSVRLRPFGSIWSLWGVKKEVKWNVYGRLQALFEHKRLRVRKLVRTIPIYLGIVLGCVLVYLPLLALIPVNKSHGVAALIAYYVVLILVGYKVLFHHSIVELRYAREATTIHARLKSAEPYFLVALGALLYALAERAIKAVWPG